jgi:DNA polymerase-1
MGILATCDGMDDDRVIVSCDKDLMTVPGLHYNPRAAARSVIAVSERDADYNHLRQTLTGDTCDGYPGCPGIGSEKVKRVLWGEPRQWWGQVVMAFRARGLSEADALLQARLARICRAADYDLAERRVIAWTPQPEPQAVGGAT